MHKESGFTLIELLIVVAIIAILAAIAVPNFLEAQVRAKASRARSDMRALTMAQEAYFTDWSSYTYADRGYRRRELLGWRLLTTPVAYIAAIPVPPFGEAANPMNISGEIQDETYGLGAGAVGVGYAYWPPSLGKGFPSNTWVIKCVGPDRRSDTVAPGNRTPPYRYDWRISYYPWIYVPNASDALMEATVLLYDPTNGAVSMGDILRFGGMKPPGMAFDFLYSNASR
ncbi:prepilin-type N-terminal cleavage/methylation domain-containing protein [Candidatus Sumerlaeota bacterium]|nr:prepilin-type N-terminal cleavage/methylation domain-containing protein [Candidatus Sumerlaeota bacterium]